MAADIFYDGIWIAALKKLFQPKEIHIEDPLAAKRTKPMTAAAVYLSFQKSAVSRLYQSNAGVPDEAKDSVIHRIFDEKGWNVWMGLRLRFELHEEGRRKLAHTSLIFLRGDYDFRPMFRAEWDLRADKEDHCQPHWHFYSALPSSSTFVDPRDQQWSDFQQQLHMAMCARWHPNLDDWESSSKTSINHGKDVVDWIEHVLNYVIHQCGYATTKLGTLTSSEHRLAPEQQVQTVATSTLTL